MMLKFPVPVSSPSSADKVKVPLVAVVKVNCKMATYPSAMEPRDATVSVPVFSPVLTYS